MEIGSCGLNEVSTNFIGPVIHEILNLGYFGYFWLILSLKYLNLAISVGVRSIQYMKH